MHQECSQPVAAYSQSTKAWHAMVEALLSCDLNASQPHHNTQAVNQQERIIECREVVQGPFGQENNMPIKQLRCLRH
jgi:hypothetical protein